MFVRYDCYDVDDCHKRSGTGVCIFRFTILTLRPLKNLVQKNSRRLRLHQGTSDPANQNPNGIQSSFGNMDATPWGFFAVPKALTSCPPDSTNAWLRSRNPTTKPAPVRHANKTAPPKLPTRCGRSTAPKITLAERALVKPGFSKPTRILPAERSARSQSSGFETTG